jgi:uncharacterized surface protein with fasciclin (FAS1) repeats
MKRFKLMKKTIGVLLLSSLMMSSCSDLDEYFETPDWISGSIYEELSETGNYSIFLKGIDRSGYKSIVDGKSILTVMAPTDEAMLAYLKETYNVSSIDELSDAEVKKLIGFHILYYAFKKEQLANFRPNEGDGATEEALNVNGGLFYKFRTKSQDALTFKGGDTAIYHYERLLPVFSYKMFETKSIDAAKNYNYFYPNTGWSDNSGFNIANAAVTEYADIAKNGYIYKIDRVLRPMETIYAELKNRGKYQKFLSLYDKYEYYEADDELTLEYSNGKTIYHHYHNSPLPNIACEWPVTDYRLVAALSYGAYSVFAPTDEAFDNFFNDYWKEGGYESLEEVDSVSIQDLLFNCVSSGSIAFPQEIAKGIITNSSNEVISFNTDEVLQSDRTICTNGILYGCSVLTPPAKFNSVTGPAYQYKKYSNFLYMLDNSGMVNTLTSKAVDYIMLYPDNDQLKNNAGIEKSGSKLISSASPNGMNSTAMQNYVYAHVVSPVDGKTVLPESGIKVYTTLSPSMKLYWYVKNGKITNCIKHNELLKYSGNTTTEADVYVPFKALDYRGNADGWANGHAYSYDNILMEGSFANINDSKFVRTIWGKRLDTATDFYGWINLLDKAGVVNRTSQALTFMNENCLMFVPVTSAIEQAIINGKIPGIVASGATVGSESFFENCTVTDQEALAYYVKQYFIPMSTAVISNYPFVGWGEDTASQGGLITLQQDENEVNGQVNITSTNMNIYDDGTKLSVGIINRATGTVNKRVNVISDYDYLPFVYDDGSIHFIEDVLE